MTIRQQLRAPSPHKLRIILQKLLDVISVYVIMHVWLFGSLTSNESSSARSVTY